MERTGRRTLRLDLLFYGVSLLFAAGNAMFSEFYGYRVWGNFASAGYLLALTISVVQLVTSAPSRWGGSVIRGSRWSLARRRKAARTGCTWAFRQRRQRPPGPRRTVPPSPGRGTGTKVAWLVSRWTPVAIAGLLAGVVPLFVLVFRRDPGFVWGNWPWSFPAQPEVWVVERSASLLLENGTPYPDLGLLGRPPHPDDYTPYGPAMTLFGLPRALFGDGALTDSRIAFAVVTVLVVVLAWKVMGWPRVPVLAAQLAAVSPLTLLTMVVAGDDIPVIALIVLGAALAFRASPVWAGVTMAVVITMKLTALPALAVVGVAIIAARGRRALLIFFGTVLITSAVLVIPVLSVDPQSFVEHVVLYPAGLGEAGSPAASPLPGHLIARLGSVGHAVSLALLALAACAIAAWLVIRPPRDPADVMLRTAVGLGTAIILAPATRWGYLVYPLAMFGAMLGFSAAAREELTRTPAGPTGDHARPPGGDTDTDDDPVASPDTRGIQA